MAKSNIDINEGTDYTFFIVPENDIADTITVRVRLESGSGTGTQIGSISSATSDAKNDIAIETSTLSSGVYLLEVWQDYGGSNQALLIPTEGNTVTLTVSDAFSV